MKATSPSRLRSGDKISVVAPARSLSILSPDTCANAHQRLTRKIGLDVHYSKNCRELDLFDSSRIASRVEDLHQAFYDPRTTAMLTVIGGYNSNQLLEHLDWELIERHPTILCGFSDITVLQNAIYAKVGLITYSGPHYTTFGQKFFDEYTEHFFRKCLFEREPYDLIPSARWTDDLWYLNQDDRRPVDNEGYRCVQPGTGEGTIIGGNLCSLNLLQGTPYMPKPSPVVLFLEATGDANPETVDRDLQSLLHCLADVVVAAVVFGRFQRRSGMNPDLLTAITSSKQSLQDTPVVSGVDFGHTDPMITFPVGGRCKVEAEVDRPPRVTISRQ